MALSVSAIIMKTNRLEEACQFYQALGVALKKEQHGDGPAHYTCKLGEVHFGLYELDPWTEEERRARGQETMIGFEVASLEECLKKLVPLGSAVILPPEDVPWGRRAVVLDPDGRPIELNQNPSA